MKPTPPFHWKFATEIFKHQRVNLFVEKWTHSFTLYNLLCSKWWSHLQMYISTEPNSKKESSRSKKKKSCSAPWDHFPLFLTRSDSHFCFTHFSPKPSAKNSEILKEPKRHKYDTIKYDEQTGGEALQPWFEELSSISHHALFELIWWMQNSNMKDQVRQCRRHIEHI